MVSAIADVLKLPDSPLCMKEGQALPNFAPFLSILERLSKLFSVIQNGEKINKFAKLFHSGHKIKVAKF